MHENNDDDDAHSKSGTSMNQQSQQYIDIKVSSSDNRNENKDDAMSSSNKDILNDDRLGMLVLFILYTLQGIPMGLCASIPVFLKERGVTYEGLSLFSLVSLPFSLKLLWAPFVDSCYFSTVGRRKTWLIPIQFVTGFLMIYGSQFLDLWMGDLYGSSPDVNTLFLFFFSLYFLMASQDIAVDGWALTILSRENVGYASICNTIGQTFGAFLANQGFVALSDPLWCHRYLGMNNGQSLINPSEFMNFWGWVFIITTTVICSIKAEKPLSDDDIPGTYLETYQQVVSIFRLKPIQSLCFILLTCKIGFAATDSVGSFKLQEYGMPKADLTTISPILLIVGLAMSFASSKLVSSKPLYVFEWAVPFKLCTSLLYWLIIQYTATAYASESSTVFYCYYAALISIAILHEISGTLVFNSCMSFFSKVADPTIGGTYMTLLNTVANLGSKWSNSLALWLLPKLSLTWVQTSGKIYTIDGYTVESIACLILGLLWLLYYKCLITKLQLLPREAWLISNTTNKSI